MNGAKPETLAEEKAPNRFIIRGQEGICANSIRAFFGCASAVRVNAERGIVA